MLRVEKSCRCWLLGAELPEARPGVGGAHTSIQRIHPKRRGLRINIGSRPLFASHTTTQSHVDSMHLGNAYQRRGEGLYALAPAAAADGPEAITDTPHLPHNLVLDALPLALLQGLEGWSDSDLHPGEVRGPGGKIWVSHTLDEFYLGKWL